MALLAGESEFAFAFASGGRRRARSRDGVKNRGGKCHKVISCCAFLCYFLLETRVSENHKSPQRMLFSVTKFLQKIAHPPVGHAFSLRHASLSTVNVPIRPSSLAGRADKQMRSIWQAFGSPSCAEVGVPMRFCPDRWQSATI